MCQHCCGMWHLKQFSSKLGQIPANLALGWVQLYSCRRKYKRHNWNIFYQILSSAHEKRNTFNPDSNLLTFAADFQSVDNFSHSCAAYVTPTRLHNKTHYVFVCKQRYPDDMLTAFQMCCDTRSVLHPSLSTLICCELVRRNRPGIFPFLTFVFIFLTGMSK